MPTFAEAARKVFALRRDGWRNAKHAGQWITTLEQFVFPAIGARGVDEVTTDDVLKVLSPIWHDKPMTAKRVRQRIGAVLTWAMAQGLRPDNPADAVKAVLPNYNGAGNAHRALTKCCPASPSRREPAAPEERPRPSRVRDLDEVSAVGGMPAQNRTFRCNPPPSSWPPPVA